MQHTNHLLMIRPVSFDFNEQTAINNSFQSRSADTAKQDKAAQEFDNFVKLLSANHIDVTIVNDTPVPHTPDSIFPNNWISFHQDGTICLYPMFAENRRLEKKRHVLDAVKEKFIIKQQFDLSYLENKDIFLEGTGSMVLDRENKIAYACLSPRTIPGALQEWCKKMQYIPATFTATDKSDAPIYHTNVMMCVADKYVVACLDSVVNLEEKQVLINLFMKTGKQLIAISFDQMSHFAGNMLQVNNSEGKTFLVMSTQAYRSLDTEQVNLLTQFNPILHTDIQTIELNGGGSARCMIAEVFLPVKV